MSTLKVNELDTKSGTVLTVAAGKTLDVTLANDAIGAAQIATDAVTADAIAANAVTSSEIADDAVTIAKLAATGTASATTFLRGDNAWASAAAGFDSYQVKTSSTAWTKPTGITKIVVEVLGGGGSGGGASAQGRGGGGGAGGYVMSDVIDVSSTASSTSLTIGSAGATPTANSTGNAGGASSTEIAGVTLTAGGGGAGTAGGTRDGGAGGTATGGKINLVGQAGYPGSISPSSPGGNSQYGWAGRPADTGASATGPVSTGYGAGGSGARGDEGGAGSSGGAAVDGLIVIWEYK